MKLNAYSMQLGSRAMLPLLIFLIFSTFSYAQNCRESTYRAYDGSCNNLGVGTKHWGAKEVPLSGEVGVKYDPSDPLNGMVQYRPNPRAISNAVFAQSNSIENPNDLSSFVFTWGQFIDHDIALLDEGEEKMTVPLPSDEPTFTSPISFTRSKKHEGTGLFNPRVPSNEITAWIDGSQVYGSDEQRANWLRTRRGGKLKMSRGQLLPFNTHNGEADGTIDYSAPSMADPNNRGGVQLVAGDVRAAEQPGLTLLHTLFVREHNRICEELVTKGYRRDEQIYQMARKRVGALIQSITYNEFLPALGIQLNPYYTYNASVKPNIVNEFSTAAYRIGHSMVTEELLVLSEDCSPLRDPIRLEEAFFNPRWITEYGIEPLIIGLSAQLQQKVDAKIIDGLRNFLFNIPGSPRSVGLDLATLNILRGRDHGLKDYNTIRAYFTGSRIQSFDQINSDPAVWQPLAEVYKYDVNNIDPWVGMLAEEHYSGSSIGPTIYHILKMQFERLRDGDRYYYMYDRAMGRSMKQEIKNTKLSEVILRNTTLKNISTNVFKVQDPHSHTSLPDNTNTVVACGDITLTYGNGTIAMTGSPSDTYFFQIYNSSWRNVYSCNFRCGYTNTATDLKEGTYKVIVYGSNWRRVCYQEIELTKPIVQIDKDGDGILASEDCNDNNPNLTFVGNFCDDGNPNTIDDIVDANCNCLGTPLATSKERITCNDITITYGAGSIRFTGVANKHYRYRIQKISSYGFIENCFTNSCGHTQFYDNLTAGTYSIRIWSANWSKLCREEIILKQDFTDSDSERIIPKSTFANQQATQYKSELYPNPAYSTANLTLPDFIGQQGQVLVYNNLGQMVKSLPLAEITDSPIRIDVQALEAGIYHVHAIIEEGIKIHHKLVIKQSN